MYNQTWRFNQMCEHYQTQWQHKDANWHIQTYNQINTKPKPNNGDEKSSQRVRSFNTGFRLREWEICYMHELIRLIAKQVGGNDRRDTGIFTKYSIASSNPNKHSSCTSCGRVNKSSRFIWDCEHSGPHHLSRKVDLCIKINVQSVIITLQLRRYV